MPDLYLDVDVALAEVPVNILPLIDDTDFKSIEGAVAYNAAGMALRWHFVTCDGAYTVTSVTPTTSGSYDWTDQGDSGIYTIEIPASGGTSINNDTEGFGWFTGVATGILPWRGPVIGFRRAALNDLFLEGSAASTNLEDFFDGTGYAGGTAKLTVDVTKLLGTAWLTPGTAGTPDVNVKLWNALTTVELPLVPTTAGRKLDVSVGGEAGVDLANVGSPTTALALTGTTIAVTQKVDVETIKTQAVTCAAGVTVLASVGTAATSTAQTGDNYARLGAPAGASHSADVAAVKVDTAAIKTKTDNLPTDPADASDIAGAFATLNTKLDTIDDFLDTEIADILTDSGTTLDDLVDDLEARLTAALATALTAHSLAIGRVVVNAGSDTTHVVFKTINGAAASAVDDFYNGRVLIFTSGALMLQATAITDYVGATKTATVVATTGAPADDVTAILA